MSDTPKERETAILLAHRVLDKPHIDPDGDICMLARQFLRAIEETESLITLAKNTAIEVGGEFAANHSLNIGLNKFIAKAERIWARSEKR